MTDTANAREAWSYEYHDIIEPTIALFYKPRTISLLVFLISSLIYAGLYIILDDNIVSNVKFGMGAAFGIILITGLLEFKDGPFIRPHPALWRIVLAINVAYLMVLSFILFQKKENIRTWLAFIDPELGVPLPERSYAEDCSLNGPAMWVSFMLQTLSNDTETIGRLCSRAHAWMVRKSLDLARRVVLLDPLCLFEIMEYSLEHQLPNFAVCICYLTIQECWWDHWILDVLLTNWLGLYLGMKTCQYFSMKQYSWRGIRDIPTASGKLKRTMQQFTPHSWTSFQWGATKSFKNFVAVVCMLYLALQCELNAFYLKYLLWIPVNHYFNLWRLILFFLFSIPAVREAYQFVSDPRCKQLGTHAWMTAACVVLELLICIKFGRGEFDQPAPTHVILFWSVLLTGFVGYVIWRFGIPALQRLQKRWRRRTSPRNSVQSSPRASPPSSPHDTPKEAPLPTNERRSARLKKNV